MSRTSKSMTSKPSTTSSKKPAKPRRCHCFDSIASLLHGLRREGHTTERIMLERRLNLLSKAAVSKSDAKQSHRVWTQEPKWWKDCTDSQWKNPRQLPKDTKETLCKKIQILVKELRDRKLMTEELAQAIQEWENGTTEDLEMTSDVEAVIAKVSSLHFMLERISQKIKETKRFSKKVEEYFRVISACFSRTCKEIDAIRDLLDTRDKRRRELWDTMGVSDIKRQKSMDSDSIKSPKFPLSSPSDEELDLSETEFNTIVSSSSGHLLSLSDEEECVSLDLSTSFSLRSPEKSQNGYADSRRSTAGLNSDEDTSYETEPLTMIVPHFVQSTTIPKYSESVNLANHKSQNQEHLQTHVKRVQFADSHQQEIIDLRRSSSENIAMSTNGNNKSYVFPSSSKSTECDLETDGAEEMTSPWSQTKKSYLRSVSWGPGYSSSTSKVKDNTSSLENEGRFAVGELVPKSNKSSNGASTPDMSKVALKTRDLRVNDNDAVRDSDVDGLCFSEKDDVDATEDEIMFENVVEILEVSTTPTVDMYMHLPDDADEPGAQGVEEINPSVDREFMDGLADLGNMKETESSGNMKMETFRFAASSKPTGTKSLTVVGTNNAPQLLVSQKNPKTGPDNLSVAIGNLKDLT